MRNIFIYFVLFLSQNIYSQSLGKGLMSSNTLNYLHIKEKKENLHEKIYKISPEIKWVFENGISLGAEYQYQHSNFFSESTQANIDPLIPTSNIVKSASFINIQNKFGFNSGYYFKLNDNFFLELEGSYLYGRNKAFINEDANNASNTMLPTSITTSTSSGGTIHRLGEGYYIPNRLTSFKGPLIIHSFQFYTSLKSLYYFSKKMGILFEIPIFRITRQQNYDILNNDSWKNSLTNEIKVRNLTFGFFYFLPTKKVTK